MNDHIKALLLVLAFFLTVSQPVLGEDLVNSNTRKLENIKLMQDKIGAEQVDPSASNETDISTNGESNVSLVRLFQGMGICIAVFLIGVHIYKKYILKTPLNYERSLKIVERLALNGKSQLCLVEVMNKKILVAVGPDKVSFFQENEVLNSFGNYTDLSMLQGEKELCKSEVN